MNNAINPTNGIKLLIEKCREEFRCPENTDYYDEDDYKEAERKFIKYRLHGHPDY